MRYLRRRIAGVLAAFLAAGAVALLFPSLARRGDPGPRGTDGDAAPSAGRSAREGTHRPGSPAAADVAVPERPAEGAGSPAPAAPSPAAAPGSIEVTAVYGKEDDRRVMAGVRVSVGTRPKFGKDPRAAVRSWSTMTDEHGVARFAELSPGWYGVQVFAAGFEDRGCLSVVEPGEATAVLRVLDPAPLVSGRVTSAKGGKPVAGAKVWRLPGWHAPGAEEEPTAVTDEGGVFRLPEQGCVGAFRIFVRGEGFLDAWIDRSIPERPEDGLAVDVRLGTEVVVHGVVRDSGGAPVEGVRVTARGPGGMKVESQGSQASSGADGTYRLRGLASGGSYGIFLSGRFPGRESEQVQLELPVDAGELALDLVFQPPGSLVVLWSTLSGSAGDAASEGTVELLLAGHQRPLETTILRSSSSFRGLQPGRYTVRATTPSGSGEVEVEVKSGESSEVVVPLVEGAVIEGVVVDPRGRLVAEADLEVFPTPYDEEASSGPSVASTTDGAGRFRFAGLRPGRKYGFRVDGRPCKSEGRPGVVAPASGLALTVDRSGIVRGRFVLPGGDMSPRSVECGFQVAREGGEWKDFRRQAEVRRSGFLVLDVPPGRLRFAARTQGFVFPSTEIVVPPADGVDLGVLEMRPGPVLAGRVLDGAGRPVKSAVVGTGPGTILRVQGHTNAEGRFDLGTLPEGSYELEASATGFENAQRRIVLGAGTESVEFVLMEKSGIPGDEGDGE